MTSYPRQRLSAAAGFLMDGNNMSKTILLKNGALLDVKHNGDIADILVENGMITAVERGIADSAAQETVDLAGCTVLPGIFNNHVHFVDSMGEPAKTFNTESLYRFARNGVTGLRDMGIEPSVKTYGDYNAWKAQVTGPETPDLFSYGYFQHLCQLRIPEGMLPPPPPAPGEEPPPVLPKVFDLVGSAENAEKAAAAAMDAGCQGVKIHGFAREEELMRQVRALVKVAGTRGGFVSAHVNTSEEAMVLVECGAHEAAHVPHDLTSEADIERMAAIGFSCCPTIASYTRMLHDGMLPEYMYEAVLRNVENYHKAGVRLTVGTDFMNIIAPPYEVEGIPVFEMKMMASCGMSVQEVVAAATINSAYLCGASNAVGELRQGRRANIIAVRGKVDETFSSLENVDFVMNKGEILKAL